MAPPSIKHSFVSALPDGGDATLVRPSSWNAGHALLWGQAAITMTDTLMRFTVADATITAASVVLCSIQRTTVTNANDLNGWVYSVNVVSVGAGTFDVLVSAGLWGDVDPEDAQPNETLTLVYAGG